MITLHQLCVIENPHKGNTWNKVQTCKLLQNISFDHIVSYETCTFFGLDVSWCWIQHVSDIDTYNHTESCDFIKLLAASCLCFVRYR